MYKVTWWSAGNSHVHSQQPGVQKVQIKAALQAMMMMLVKAAITANPGFWRKVSRQELKRAQKLPTQCVGILWVGILCMECEVPAMQQTWAARRCNADRSALHGREKMERIVSLILLTRGERKRSATVPNVPNTFARSLFCIGSKRDMEYTRHIWYCTYIGLHQLINLVLYHHKDFVQFWW